MQKYFDVDNSDKGRIEADLRDPEGPGPLEFL